MRTLHRKLLRDISRTKALLLAITSIITIGVMCYVSFQSAYRNLRRAQQDYYRRCRMADFWVDIKKVPLAELPALNRIRGVNAYRSRVRSLVTVDLENVARPINGLVLSLPARRVPVINDIVLRQGDYFTDRRDNEVIINDAFARFHRVYPGQQINVLLNNRRQELVVVGTAISSEFTYLLGPGALMPDPENFGVLYIKRPFAEEVFDFEGAANQVVGTLTPSLRDNPQAVLQEIERALEDYGVQTILLRKTQASHQFLKGEIDGLGAFATVMPVIFLTVAALVLNVLINRFARQQRTVIGTFKALGYSDRQIFAHFLQYGLVIGLLGGLSGSGLGLLLSTGMTVIYRQYFEFPRLLSGFYWDVHAIGISVSVLCSMGSALHGARQMLQLQPALAMRPAPPSRGRAVFLERFPWLWSQLDSATRLAVRQTVRHRIRTATAIFASAMASGLLVAGLMLQASQYFLLDFQFHQVMRSDLELVLESHRGAEAVEEVRRLPGVDYVEPVLNVPCTLVHGPYRRKAAITGLVADARLTVPRSVSGQPLRLNDSGITITRYLADLLHVNVGDRITFIPSQGERRPQSLPVAQIADTFLGLTVYARIEYLSQLVGEELAITNLQVLLDQDPEHQRALFSQLKQAPAVQSVTTRKQLVGKLEETILQSQYVFIFMIVGFSGSIFFGSILNGLLVSLSERNREVATLLCLGYSPWQVGGMFLRECLMTNMPGAVLGLPVGYFLCWLMTFAYNSELIRLPLVGPSWVWISTLLLAVVFALLAYALVQWRIHAMDFADALKTTE